MAMVSEAKVNGSGVEAPADVLPALAEKPAGLPPGKYALVGWDMDTTGRRLIDEICQIAAFTPKQTYSQYIMPYGDLNPGARRRHNVRVVTVGRYRMLKDTNTHKILKTKSEISALTDFLDWLEKEKGDGSVILIYHEPRRLSPTMLLEALTRYKLLDRFKTIVAGFADSYALAADKCKSTVKSVSLRVLARVLLDADTLSVDSALDRATAAYRIVEHLAQGEQQEVGAGGEGTTASKDMVETARVWARPVHTELEALANFKKLLERQNTFRPVFAPLLRLARPERKRVTQLRRLLADAGLLYDQLKDAWQEQKLEGLEKQLKVLTVSAKEEDIKELIDIFDCHFDPAKEPKGLKPRIPNRTRVTSSAGETGEAEGSTSESQKTSTQNSPNKTNNDVKAEPSQNTAPEAVVAN
ncbi:maternal protein exuperantia [Vanessa tameamea]|uniref:Maternal protein exuperantia n=1 Tax=Vanessa tameamea TaxID=334116 RepID=A0A8B8IL28_VANTA|nr:maternal protein exuperantia [Vanessa tameamea]XP_026497808.1 maternal protein exuperantia [Vanessa tameamea]XP_026497809.1 maternal protein exuperantia [Vanessa tameamea]XP_026497810.1 maternal protein exuperantia [Vanessa tameamea]XP_026497812.1 maternal protein exuperantia [Vanessa tameamea]